MEGYLIKTRKFEGIISMLCNSLCRVVRFTRQGLALSILNYWSRDCKMWYVRYVYMCLCYATRGKYHLSPVKLSPFPLLIHTSFWTSTSLVSQVSWGMREDCVLSPALSFDSVSRQPVAFITKPTRCKWAHLVVQDIPTYLLRIQQSQDGDIWRDCR